MGLTLSYLSALDVLRTLRHEGVDVRSMDAIALSRPKTWVGRRWGLREFASDVWRWASPSAKEPLHVLVPGDDGRVRMSGVTAHRLYCDLPGQSILWLDENSSMVSPELLFVQMSDCLSLPMHVLLGYELCGNFSRSARLPLSGSVTTHVPAATSVASLCGYLDACCYLRGTAQAREALRFVGDHALSAPEAVLATMYSLPAELSGYGMGPISLNERVVVGEGEDSSPRHRFPDLSFSFAPVGINYDGEDHLRLDSIVEASRRVERADASERAAARASLDMTLEAVRAKVVDDIRRNRELAAKGKLVFPATKEDLSEDGGLDRLTGQILACSHAFFGTDVTRWESVLSDTFATRDRRALLASMLPGGRALKAEHGFA